MKRINFESLSNIYNIALQKNSDKSNLNSFVDSSGNKYIVNSLDGLSPQTLTTFEIVSRYYSTNDLPILEIIGTIEQWKESNVVLIKIDDRGLIEGLGLSNSKIKALAEMMARLHRNKLADLSMEKHFQLIDINTEIAQRLKIIKEYLTDKSNVKEISKRFHIIVDPTMIELQESHLENLNIPQSSVLTLGFYPENLFYSKGENQIYINLPVELYLGNPLWDIAKCFSEFHCSFPKEKSEKFRNIFLEYYEKSFGEKNEDIYTLEALILFFDLDILYKLLSSNEYRSHKGDHYMERIMKKLKRSHLIKWN